MEGEFALKLRYQSNQPGIVRPGRYFREPDFVAFHKQFDPEHAQPAQRAGDRRRHLAGLGARCGAHRLGLPGFHIIARHLDMADGLAEMGAVRRPHGQLGDLEIEFHFAFQNDARFAHPPGVQRFLPSGRDIGCGGQPALALAGGGHHRLDERRIADTGRGRLQFFQRGGEGVRRSGQAQFLGGEAADALAVHGDMGGAGGGDDGGEAVRLDPHQFVGRQRLDLRHDQMRALALDQRPQGGGVGHVDHMGAMGNLLRGRVVIAVDRNGLHPQPLQLDHHFLAQLARAQQHHLDGGGRESGVPNRALRHGTFSDAQNFGRWLGASRGAGFTPVSTRDNASGQKASVNSSRYRPVCSWQSTASWRAAWRPLPRSDGLRRGRGWP